MSTSQPQNLCFLTAITVPPLIVTGGHIVFKPSPEQESTILFMFFYSKMKTVLICDSAWENSPLHARNQRTLEI